jgi:phosphate-selective porin OprO and OprP
MLEYSSPGKLLMHQVASRIDDLRKLAGFVLLTLVATISLQAQDRFPFSDPLNAIDGLPYVRPASATLPIVHVAEDASVDELTVEQLSKRIETIEKELSEAKAEKEKSDKQKSEADKKKSDSADGKDKASNPRDRFKEKWTVKLGGHVQADYINWANANPAIVGAQDYFEFRRLRLTADGTGYGVYDFRLQMTLEPETIGETQPLGTVASPDVKDAYLSMNEIPFFGRFRIGHFFVPFSLEQVTNDTNNIFMERSIPTQGIFSADREVGFAFYNCTEDQRVTWTTGVFFDSISEGLKERIDDNQGIRVSGRATWLPFYDEQYKGRYLVHTGVGVLHTDDHDNRVRFRARPQIREGPRLIDSQVINADKYTTANLEAAIVNGPIALQSEAFVSTVDRLTGNNVSVQGCYVHGSYFLTGENRVFEKFGQHGAQFSRNVPNRNFVWHRDMCGPGAWELKSRWSYLDLSSVGAGQYNDLTCGMNWYWSDRTRVMFDWIHPMPSSGTVYGSGSSDILAMRFDFNW